MKLIRYSVFAAATGLALAAFAAEAGAGDKGCSSCGGGFFGGHGGGRSVPQATLFGSHHKQPVFQAAPWYQYWPYDAHFLTPAPVSGAFYGPPMTGNFPVNPYFPGPAGQAGFGFGYGGIPGGPPPGYPTMPLPGPGPVPSPMPPR